MNHHVERAILSVVCRAYVVAAASAALTLGCEAPKESPSSTGQISSAAPVSSGQTSSAPVAAPNQMLESKTPLERELRVGETHVYGVVVPEDHVVIGTVDQRGVDLAVKLVNPAGKTVATIDSPNGTSGPEPWTIEAKPSGTWRVEVMALDPKTTGHYEVRINDTITSAEHAERKAKLRYRSSRLLQLWKEHRADGAKAIEGFAKEMTAHAPLVEPIEGDPRGDVLITFFYLGDADTHYVGLIGGPVGPGFEHNLLRFEDSQLWYLSVRAPKDLRIAYSFRPGDPPNAGATQKETDASFFTMKPDPWNPRQMQGRSLIELPGAPPQPWTERKEGVATGRVVEKTLHSDVLKEDRKFGVYLPAKFESGGKPYPYVIVFDGEMYGHSPNAVIPTPVILDNLIAQGKVPPMLAVLLDSDPTRSRDLSMSATFCDFLAKELVPWLRKEHNASNTPADATLAGASLGGLASTYCAFHHPDVFGNALSQSGSYWFVPGAQEALASDSLETGAMMREIIDAPKKPIRFWMEVGSFEGGGGLVGSNMVAQNRHMRDVLLLKGYDVSYHEYAGGHDYASWRGSLADGLMTLLSKPTKSPKPTGTTKVLLEPDFL